MISMLGQNLMKTVSKDSSSGGKVDSQHMYTFFCTFLYYLQENIRHIQEAVHIGNFTQRLIVVQNAVSDTRSILPLLMRKDNQVLHNTISNMHSVIPLLTHRDNQVLHNILVPVILYMGQCVGQCIVSPDLFY